MPEEPPLTRHPRLSEVLLAFGDPPGFRGDASSADTDDVTMGELDELLDVADNGEFVASAYELVLGRRVDPEGLSSHVPALDGGLVRGEFLLQLSGSAEGRLVPGGAVLHTLLRAHRVGVLLAASGSSVNAHLIDPAAGLEQAWPWLWVDAVRDVLPDLLQRDAQRDAFAAALRSGCDVRQAVLEAWKDLLDDVGPAARIVGRLTMRFRWRTTWREIHSSFREGLGAYASIVSLVHPTAAGGGEG